VNDLSEIVIPITDASREWRAATTAQLNELVRSTRLAALREARDLAWNKSRSTMNDIEKGELRAAKRINDLIERQS